MDLDIPVFAEQRPKSDAVRHVEGNIYLLELEIAIEQIAAVNNGAGALGRWCKDNAQLIAKVRSKQPTAMRRERDAASQPQEGK